MAISIYNIMTIESYKDDFKNDTEFAKFLGTSKGNLSKISRAGKLLKENENLSAFNLGQIEETLPLNDETRNYIIEEKEIKPSMTVKEVREVVNAYKSDGKEETEEIEETEETEETENSNGKEAFHIIQFVFFNECDTDPVRTVVAHSTEELSKLLEELKNVEIK